MIFTLQFWKDAIERAVEIGAHALLGTLGVSMALSQFHWAQALDVGAGAAVISLLVSLGARPQPGTPAAVGPLAAVARRKAVAADVSQFMGQPDVEVPVPPAAESAS